MSLIDVILLGVALGIDCLVVSFSQGLIFKSDRVKNSMKLALVMGLFQGLFPVIGYVGTNSLYDFLLPYSRWIVFGIFFVLGVKFIAESFAPKVENLHCIGIKCLIGLGVATSIDALVSGATLKLTNTSLLLAGVFIGVISFFMSLFGFWSAGGVKNISPRFLEVVGGIILIMLAVKAVI